MFAELKEFLHLARVKVPTREGSQTLLVAHSQLCLKLDQVQTKWEGCKRETIREDVNVSGWKTQSNMPYQKKIKVNGQKQESMFV